jgi:ABC-type multidrug transport system ATPase subunit
MTLAQWEDFLKTLYWDRVLGDKINSQGIAEILFESVWGGSSKSLVIYLQTYLRQKNFTNNKGETISVDGAIGKNTVEALNKLTKEYSKGMLQRLGFISALIHNPKLLILDEPLSGLDPVGRQDFKKILVELNKGGVSIFFSSRL